MKAVGTSSALTSTRAMALKLLLSCERRLASNPQLAEGYQAFMGEYIDLDHMEPVTDLGKKTNAYYLPHHAVVKRHDPSTKLRVVFNASFPTSTGNSLNDCLCTGPKLQADLWPVLTRWRLFRKVFTSDIVKMYRQIRVHTLDRQWQRILWRQQPNEPVRDYDLSTVTYGTSCAPFLALRGHTYVDDILAGADDEGLLQELKKKVVAIFEAGAFHLAKWASNTPSLQEKDQSEECLFQEASGIGTLGVLWSSKTDSFSLRVNLPANPSARYTKRRILSEVASLFDPLGWAAPMLIFAKVLMQDLWILGVEWDQDLPQKLQTSWVSFKESLYLLNTLNVPRWIHFTNGHQELELYGFCDASQRAYAAAVYLRVVQGEAIFTTLLVAKTRVAPVKTISIPRLELCGAVLLAKLIVQVKQELDIPAPITAWTDSTVTLHWIKGHASL
ncbi:uncharacterized protein LOC143264354 [Megachile rotundata]|uniref:uncharacterized protein LOC143264354 n=1 Tax=Megachile rotundata TaxID=143995 RepID=UPI003FD45CA2